MTVGSVVYLCWYDFQKRTEHVCKGEVVDNSLYGGTQWEDWVNVQFKPVGMKTAIQHHFRPERLSEDANNVPHDEAYIVCGKEAKVDYQKVKGNPWLVMTEFKQAHWDDEHNRLQVDALEEFYRLWAVAMNWRIGYEVKKAGKKPDVDATVVVAKTAGKPAGTVAKKAEAKPQHTEQEKPSAKAQGTVVKKKKEEVVQLSLFD